MTTRQALVKLHLMRDIIVELQERTGNVLAMVDTMREQLRDDTPGVMTSAEIRKRVQEQLNGPQRRAAVPASLRRVLEEYMAQLGTVEGRFECAWEDLENAVIDGGESEHLEGKTRKAQRTLIGAAMRDIKGWELYLKGREWRWRMAEQKDKPRPAPLPLTLDETIRENIESAIKAEPWVILDDVCMAAGFPEGTPIHSQRIQAARILRQCGWVSYRETGGRRVLRWRSMAAAQAAKAIKAESFDS